MSTGKDVNLFVSVPVCSFRKGYAREFFETEEIPPPSTIYGFLLSLVGEESRYRYIDTRIAYGLLETPKLSILLRTTWRYKSKKNQPGVGENRRPDYQEILTGLELAVWIQEGEFANRIIDAGLNPSTIERYGGLSLGESRDLVNDVVWFPHLEARSIRWVITDDDGDYPLPIWVDHVGSKDTIWQQFKLEQGIVTSNLSPEDRCWVQIRNYNVSKGNPK